jgi:hypothetical protein
MRITLLKLGMLVFGVGLVFREWLQLGNALPVLRRSLARLPRTRLGRK